MVDDHEIAEKLRTLSLVQAADALIELTLARGAKDNVTLALVRAINGVDDTLGGKQPVLPPAIGTR